MNKIKDFIAQRGLTQVQVARDLGYSEEHVNRIVNGRSKIAHKPARRIADLDSIVARNELAQRLVAENHTDHDSTLKRISVTTDNYTSTIAKRILELMNREPTAVNRAACLYFATGAAYPGAAIKLSTGLPSSRFQICTCPS